MSKVLEYIDDVEKYLWATYGNPLTDYKKTEDDIRTGVYLAKLMKEQGHESSAPEGKEGLHYSEKALLDAFLAGRLLAKIDNARMRKAILSTLKDELHDAIENL
jgi:hypothetical protein